MDDFPNNRSGYLELFAKFLLGEIPLKIKVPDLDDLLVGQFCLGMVCPLEATTQMSSMSDTIKRICVACIPSEIIQKAIRPGTISVAALHSFWAWTNEVFQNKSVYKATVSCAISSQRDKKVSFESVCFKDSLRLVVNHPVGAATMVNLSPMGFNPSLIGNFISGKIMDWFENLLGCGKVLVSHAVSLLVRGASGLEPGKLRKQFPARSFSFIPQAYGFCNG